MSNAAMNDKTTGKARNHVEASDALRALRVAFGFRLDAPRERGRQRMAAVIEERCGVRHDTAEEAVYALEHAGVIRFVHDDAGEDGAPLPQGLPWGATAPAPVIPKSPAGYPVSPGHWRIGEAG